jgi:hypothetical protein
MSNHQEVNVAALEQALRMLGGEQAVVLVSALYQGLDEAEARGQIAGMQDGFQDGFLRGIENAERTYEDGHNDGFTAGYVDGVRDARSNPKRADATVAGMSTEYMDAETLATGVRILNAENPEDRNAEATDSDVPGCFAYDGSDCDCDTLEDCEYQTDDVISMSQRLR